MKMKWQNSFLLFFDPNNVGGLGGSGGVITHDGKTANSERAVFDLVDDVISTDKKTDKKVEKEETEETEETEEETEDEGDTEETEEGQEEDTEEDIEEESEEEQEEEEETEEETEESEALEDDSVYQALKKADPKIFKKVPELRSVIFREQKFSSIYPNIEAAEAAANKASTFDVFQNDIISGNSEPLLRALQKIGEDETKGFVANLLPTLKKVSKELHLEVVAPEIKTFLKWAHSQGDENIKISASNLHQIFFGDKDFDKEVGLKTPQEDEREKSYKKREQELEEKRFNIFANDVTEVAVSRTKKVIARAFGESGLSNWQIERMTDDIFSRVQKSLADDRRHMGNINGLWKKAKDAGFTSSSKDSIVNAFLSRAKLLIPRHRAAVLSEAKVSATVSKDGTKKKVKRVSGSSSIRSTTSSSASSVDPKKVDWNKTSERALLDGAKPVMRG
jgi:hypothetical protein